MVKHVEAPPFPKRIPNRIPQEAIDLTNRALKASYPDHFGKLILPLTQDAIWVSSDRDHIAFVRKWANDQTHPVVNASNLRLMRTLGAREPNFTKIWAENLLPDRPIFYHEGDLRLLAKNLKPIPDREDRLNIGNSLIARILIHESLHRSTNPTPHQSVDFNNPLVGLTLSLTQRRIEVTSDPKFKSVFMQDHEDLLEYAETQDLMINSSGARISLYSPDDKGRLRVILSSGYDLEEALVDWLGEKPYQYIVTSASRNASRFAQQAIALNVEAIKHNSRNHQVENLAPKLGGILKSIGLHDIEEVLQAFVGSRIALLHSQLQPNKPYYP